MEQCVYYVQEKAPPVHKTPRTGQAWWTQRWIRLWATLASSIASPCPPELVTEQPCDYPLMVLECTKRPLELPPAQKLQMHLRPRAETDLRLHEHIWNMMLFCSGAVLTVKHGIWGMNLSLGYGHSYLAKE